MDNVRWVIAHLASGDFPALVVAEFGSVLSLTVFRPGEIIHRDNVQMYVFEAGDEIEDKVGYWSEVK